MSEEGTTLILNSNYYILVEFQISFRKNIQIEIFQVILRSNSKIVMSGSSEQNLGPENSISIIDILRGHQNYLLEEQRRATAATSA